jgi:hypothetical protein
MVLTSVAPDSLLLLVQQQGPRHASQGGRAGSRGDGNVPSPVSIPARCSQTWAMLIKRVYEIDPLACPQCGGQMKVIAFIEPP